MMKLDRRQRVAESLEMTVRYLDPTGSDMDGNLQAYIEANVGIQPEDRAIGWDDDLWDTYARLKNFLQRLDDKELMNLINDQDALAGIVRDFFELYESEYEIKVVDLLAHELQIAVIRGYSRSEAGSELEAMCKECQSLMNRG